MDNTEKRAMIQEMVDRLVLAERNVTVWTDEVVHASNRCEMDRAKELYSCAADFKRALRSDFDKTLKEILP